MIDLTPFEPCSPLLRDYLTRTLDVQAPGPRRERDEPVRPGRTDVRCRQTPAETGDAVPRQAVASKGIETSLDAPEAPPAIPLRETPEVASGTSINSGDSARVSIPRAPRVGARRGGRPRTHASDVIARREARRAYRQRRARKAA